MSAVPGPPPDHRVGRQARLLRFLRIATLVTVVAAGLGMFVPGPAGRTAGGVVVATLIVVPVVRIVWLVQRWLRRGDLRYAAVAGGLLVILASATLAG